MLEQRKRTGAPKGGKKPLSEVEETVIVAFKVPKSTKERFKRASQNLGFREFSGLLRVIMDSWLKEYEKTV